jgi:hypothetical protein
MNNPFFLQRHDGPQHGAGGASITAATHLPRTFSLPQALELAAHLINLAGGPEAFIPVFQKLFHHDAPAAPVAPVAPAAPAPAPVAPVLPAPVAPVLTAPTAPVAPVAPVPAAPVAAAPAPVAAAAPAAPAPKK